MTDEALCHGFGVGSNGVKAPNLVFIWVLPAEHALSTCCDTFSLIRYA